MFTARWSPAALLVVLGSVYVAACQLDPVGLDLPAFRLAAGDTSLTNHMLAKGCTARPQPKAGKTNAIIKLPGGAGTRSFDCASFDRAKLDVAVNAWATANRPPVAGGSAIRAEGGWYSRVREWCYATGGGWVGNWWVLGDGDSLYGCFLVVTWYQETSFPDYPPDYDPYLEGGGEYPEMIPPEKPTVVACDTSSAYTVPAEEMPPFAEGAPPTYCFTDSCMTQNPGVWIGSSDTYFPFDARHTAIATVPPILVTELYQQMGISHISVRRPGSGYYANPYRWVRVAGPGQVSAVNTAIDERAPLWQGIFYAGHSNLFVGEIAKRSQILLTEPQRNFLGNTPFLCVCGACLQ